MWEINNTEQIFAFLYSISVGAAFCLFYDLFRSIRSVIRVSDIAIFLQDIFYFIIISFVTFVFLLGVTNGEVRGYVIFGILCGFFICYFTFSKLFLKLVKFVLKFFTLFFNKINAVLNVGILKADNFITKILNIIKNTLKKGLKKVKGLLYTKK